MRNVVLLAAALLAGVVMAKENVLVVCAHPDDTISIAGTVYLMRDRFNVVVADLTAGQRGLGEEGFKDGSTERKRRVEEENGMKVLGSTVRWMGFEDGALYATHETCQAVADLIAELKPRAVFAMWPIDRHQDHSMAGTIALKAAWLAKYRGEFYYYSEAYGSKGFAPSIFVDITKVIDKKQEYARCHVCQNKDDGMNKIDVASAKDWGWKCFYFNKTGRRFAEVFAPLSGFHIQGDKTIFSELPQPE